MKVQLEPDLPWITKRHQLSPYLIEADENNPTLRISDQGELLEVDLNNDRRKRRKTAPLDGIDQIARSRFPYFLLNPEEVQPSGISQSTMSVNAGAARREQFDLPGGSTRIEYEELNQGTTTSELSTNVEKPRVRDEIGIGIPSMNIIPGLDQKWYPIQQEVIPSYDCPNAIEPKPRKVLKLNPKTGTFGSPPPKPKPVEIKTKKSIARGKQQKSRLVTIRYGPGLSLPTSLGSRIDEILNSARTLDPVPKRQASDSNSAKGQRTCLPKVPKSIHPLFLGKLAPKPSLPKPTPEDSSAEEISVNFSPFNKVRITSHPRPSVQRPSLNVKGSTSLFSSFGNTSKLVKFPGAVHPAWPWRGMLHVRGSEPKSLPSQSLQPVPTFQNKPKKSKSNAICIPAVEDIIEALATDLHIGEVAKSIESVDLDQFPPIPACLRIATKLNESGISIQERIRKQLRSRPHYYQPTHIYADDEFQFNTRTDVSIHPAVLKAYAAIATSLSAFDKGQCEIQSWAQKYSPQSADEVLQSGNEAVLLKEWLQALTVNAVESAGGPSSLPKKVVPPKRKRKAKKLDGFIVSSDDEDNFISYNVSENDSEVSQSKNKKTVVKRAKATGKLNNSILISGPHGCGKTAAVYAVAKELGFEVFEINAGSRRCGKDILDKVGDMTRNHLVHHSADQVMEPLDADEKRVDDALANDLKSGRQGTMNSFFMPQQGMAIPDPKPMPILQNLLTQEKPVEYTRADIPRQPPREQKQSLVLIEEVDVLYKEDSQFWPTIVNLIQSSRRPIIMTCNDDSVIDMSSLALHGVLRLTPQPVDLAVDYMLLVAACEGHLLERTAVESLYETRNQDLRASLMDLNYWCQFGVGSVKGGLDWFYSRFPRGSDIDQDGNIIRVVSEDTYRASMGCLSQDFLESHIHHLDIEEEVLHEAWDGWQLDASDWHTSLKMTEWADKYRPESRDALFMYEEFSTAMSDSDLISFRALASSDLEFNFDTDTLKLTQKALDDCVLPHRVLETSHSNSNTARDMSFWLRSRSRAYLQVDQHVRHDLEVPAELDRLTESSLMTLVQGKDLSNNSRICRNDIDIAFESISNSEKTYAWSNSIPLISVFSGTIATIVEDAAPYVRSIVAYDGRLAQDRTRMSNLLSEGGTKGKRMRTTRAAMSALEGGARKTTRRERYFNSSLNPYLVAKTGMQNWMDISIAQVAAESEFLSTTASRRSSNGSISTENAFLETDEVAETLVEKAMSL
jgi:hypothetical protein